MHPLFKNLKERFERISGCRIYRHTRPHGLDCYLDIEKRFGRDGIRMVFDVGANIGLSAAAYVQEFPRAQIHSFEPVAATYRELVQATKPFPRVHPHHLGMGREAGKATIHVNPYSPVSSIVLSRPEDHPETIELETISGFAEKQGIETIDFLKIDTEGYDLEVLAGAASLLQQQKIHFVQCECEPVARTKQFPSFPDLTACLDGFGYRPFGIYEQQPEWDGSNCLLFLNAIFICEKLVPRGARL